MNPVRVLAAPVAAFFLLVAVFVGGVYSGARWFPRHIIQPIAGKPIILPGQKVERIEKVPGPIREIVRTIERTDTRYVFTTRPPELSPEQTKKAQEQALRRFILSMEIPAGQLIPCKTPRLVQGGMACGEPVTFRAEILEPSVGVFVPLVLPGEIARPTELRVEVKPEVVGTAPARPTHLSLYPLGVSTWPTPHLVSEVSYRNVAFGGTYDVRVSWHYSGLGVDVRWGRSW